MQWLTKKNTARHWNKRLKMYSASAENRNLLRRLADKRFVLCTVVLRRDQYVVDRCGMLGYVPMSLPRESAENMSSIMEELERPVPSITFDEAAADPCVAHISRELQEIEDLHALELWRTAELNKSVTSEMLLRSMVKLLIGGAYLLSLTLNRRELPEGTTRQEISGLVLSNRNLLITFASTHLQPAAQASLFIVAFIVQERREECRIHVRKYAQEIAQTAGRILDISLDPRVQWDLIRTLMVVPFWLFAFGRYCGPADKNASFELGYGFCPLHLLDVFIKDATDTCMEQQGLQNWAKRSISKLVKRVEAGTFPDKAKEHANVFLEQHLQDLPQLSPDLFRRGEQGKIFKVLAQLQSSDTAVRNAAEDLLNKSSLQQLLPALAAAASASEEDESTTISQTAPFGFILQWLDAQPGQGVSSEEECLLWLLVDRLADIADPEVYVPRTDQLVQKLNLTFQQLDVKKCAAGEEALETLFYRTSRWKTETAEAKEAKTKAITAYCSLCPVVLQMISRQPSPELLAPLVSLAERGPQFFRDQHAALLAAVKSILGNSSVETEETPQHLPLVDDLLMLLADAAAASPSDWEDLTTWEAQTREEETGEETLHSVALQLMADIASMLCGSAQEPGADGGYAEAGTSSTGGPHVLSKLMNIFSLLVEQEDPRYSYTALELLALLLDDDTCRPLLGPYVDKLTMTCIAALKAADARLRWQGLKCLGSMVENEEKWTQQVQQQHGGQLLSLLSERSAEDPSVRCRRQALLALASFLSGLAPEEGEDPSPETLAFVAPHMNGVLSKAVIAGCSSNDMQTQEFALALASALAKAAVEFAADLGSAVGKDVLRPDAPWLVDRLHSLLLACEAVPAASAVFSSIMVCLGVAAPACGPELLQQMQPLMDIVIRKAQLSIQMGVAQEVGGAAGSLNAGAELSEEGGVSQFRVQDKSGKQTIISINTAAVEERLAALRLLGALASAVGAAAPVAWAKDWTAVALDSCSSEFAIVRSAAFEVRMPLSRPLKPIQFRPGRRSRV
ncbi:uncharacterized protein EMH_0037830 [Eimeria mitis]|uniref:HEAT repeat-containing protein n=1 Tax=Eimeria mitis TaxID=44415 RepID=U6JRK3_9EIME|nr:uncharacterized protein EMH_0037830 [Eimeria mitis]CDJ28095.1 hypothetical protein EMH_0037830 [Eimeria mitis]